MHLRNVLDGSVEDLCVPRRRCELFHEGLAIVYTRGLTIHRASTAVLAADL